MNGGHLSSERESTPRRRSPLVPEREGQHERFVSEKPVKDGKGWNRATGLPRPIPALEGPWVA